MLDTFKEYWQSRASRDRQIIQLIALLAALALAYAYLWMPMNAARARLRTELPKLRGTVAQVNRQAQEIAGLKASPMQVTRVAPQELINQSAEQAGIKGDISQITPLSPERIQVTLNNVAFDNWIRWSQALAAQSGVRVESAQIASGSDPGMVKVQTVFALPGR